MFNSEEKLEMENMYPEESKHAGSYEPKDPPANGQKTIYKTVRKFALDETTAHGFPNMFRARTYIGRLMWMVIFLAGVAGTIYQGTLLVMKFANYPVNVEVKIVTKPSLEFPSVTVCNTNKLRLSAIDKSRHRQMLVVDQTASLPYYEPCLEDDFACKKRSVCIKKYLLCDGIRQCGKDDPSDERGCNFESHTCTNRQFRCGYSGSSTGLCIPAKKKCNGKKDCYDGEDEDDCECKAKEFKCRKRGGCIPKKSVCDGNKDCGDESDEREDICGSGDCNPSWFFHCLSGDKCIPNVFLCDGFPDCLDRSDENAIKCLNYLQSEEPAREMLDLPAAIIPPPCPSSKFMCNSDRKCISEGWTCDGYLDCLDGSDETLELCGRPLCTPPKIPCAVGGGCGIPCDLKPECLLGIDEKNCTCNVSRIDNREVVVQRVSCEGLSSEKYYSAREYTYLVSCGTGDGNTVETRYYNCAEGLECYNPTTMLPEPCKTVFSECYTSFGQDYQGTETWDHCLQWSDPVVASLNYTGRHYWELEGVEPGSTVGHRFCRNPGGGEPGPWCLADVGNGTYNVMLCELKQLPKKTCHRETFDVTMPHTDSTETPSQGRVEVSFGTFAKGTISDPDWTLNDAHVVCRQLGFLAGAMNVSTDFELGTGYVLLKDVQCVGTEQNLIDCFYRLASGQDTDHTHDVGVVCNDSLPLLVRRKRDIDAIGGNETKQADRIHASPSETPSDCGDGGFLCDSSECVRYWQTCNKFPDCRDGSDELLSECEDVLTDCRPDEFQCKEPKPDGMHKCVPKNYICDSYNDCGVNTGRLKTGTPKASDELACPLPSEKPPSNYFKCPGINNFVHEYDVCNTVKDCYDFGLDDETDCLPQGQKDEHKDPFQEIFRDAPRYLPFLNKLTEKQQSLFKDFAPEFRTPMFGRVKGEDPPDWNGFVTFSTTPDYSDLIDIAKLTKEEVSQSGHQKEDFILQCTYEQRKCNILSDFEELQDDRYGNCFTFNANKESKNSSKSGSRYGLQLTLNLEQNEYISIYGQEAGVRVSIDPPNIRPHPADNGITVKPGAVTSIGLRYNYVLQRGPPYGKCQKKPKIMNQGVKYDRRLCQKMCFHEHILEYCGCSDTLELNETRCKLLNETQEVCRQFVYYLSQHNNLTCNCPQQCSNVHYTKTSSMSKWPSKNFAKHLLRNIHSLNNKTLHLNEENVFDNIVRLEVFYEELNYESTKEVPAYQESSLFGDIGGIAGLYIGFSMITVCEFIALFVKLIKKSCCKSPVKI